MAISIVSNNVNRNERQTLENMIWTKKSKLALQNQTMVKEAVVLSVCSAYNIHL